MKLPKKKEFDLPIQELDNKIQLCDLDEPDKYFKEGVFRYLTLNKLIVCKKHIIARNGVRRRRIDSTSGKVCNDYMLVRLCAGHSG
jgi:hypothetical protein